MDLDNKIATRESFGKALVELGKENENVVVLTADLAGATKTSLFECRNCRTKYDRNISRTSIYW